MRSAVLDGELAVLDAEGRPRFYDLMRRRGSPVFVAFDMLELDGVDLRELPLLERKRALRRAVHDGAKAVQVLEHVRGKGRQMFELACSLDLEGIVAKRADSAYRITTPPMWLKLKNPAYSQAEGRYELFEKRRA